MIEEHEDLFISEEDDIIRKLGSREAYLEMMFGIEEALMAEITEGDVGLVGYDESVDDIDWAQQEFEEATDARYIVCPFCK